MHRQALATAEVTHDLVARDRAIGAAVDWAIETGGVFDFLVEATRLWNPMLSTRKLLGGWGERLYQGSRIEMSLNGIAALCGLGYSIGVR